MTNIYPVFFGRGYVLSSPSPSSYSFRVPFIFSCSFTDIYSRASLYLHASATPERKLIIFVVLLWSLYTSTWPSTCRFQTVSTPPTHCFVLFEYLRYVRHANCLCVYIIREYRTGWRLRLGTVGEFSLFWSLSFPLFLFCPGTCTCV